MSINLGNLELTLLQKISASSSPLEIQTYSSAIKSLKNGSIYSVASASNLPSFSTVIGALYYVQSEEIVYFASADGWTTLTSTTSSAIYSWGLSTASLVDGLAENCCKRFSSPTRECSSITDWSDISVSYLSIVGTRRSGQIWSWGDNYAGRLGNSVNGGAYSSPIREITSSTNWCRVSAGASTTAAIKSDNTLWNWGRGLCGALGTGNIQNQSSPVREITSSCWIDVSTRDLTTYAIKTDNTLWAWGYNFIGALGNNQASPSDVSSPVREITSSIDWCRVSAQQYGAAAIKTTGQLWTWGCNGYGVLGDNSATCRSSPVREASSSSDWCLVKIGSSHTLGIKTSGQLWSWGSNYSGLLGVGASSVSRSSPIREVSSSTNWCNVGVGNSGSYALKTDGSLWSWGSNYAGVLGTNDCVNRSSPVREITSSSDWSTVCANLNIVSGLRVKNI